MTQGTIQEAWPNVSWWSALADGATIEQNLFGDLQPVQLSVMDSGELVLPHGRLVACDPFTALQPEDNRFVQVPPGRYRVLVTLADVSGQSDGSHTREAYTTVLLSDQPEVDRRVLQSLRAGEAPSSEPLEPGEFYGFGVDAGTACFVDDGSVGVGMPDPQGWHEQLFENADPSAWFNRMDDPAHLRAGLANIPLPAAQDGANIILIHSGWGDGFYPVVGGYGPDGQLVRVHIDFGVIGDPNAADDGDE